LTDDGLTLKPTTERIGKLILEDKFLLPFEVASVLLLVALIGAALISRKEIRD
ncbi:NADH-quinone oxidoreductase subunit J, partial [Candidatus Poribacteria bacterium]|nr:NADH-quinone oxidoreductase subunit J [Candidatus Poribacteria bacterium]